jgi:type I restriction enzyme S subunit
LDRWDNSKTFTLKAKYPIKRVNEILSNISTGTTPPTARKEYFDNGTINFYTPADLTGRMYLEESERKVTQLAIDDRKARKFGKDTLLFVGIGSTVGKVGIIKNEYATSNQQITGLQLNLTIADIEFVYFYFNNFINITTKEKTQATIPIVNQNKILNIPIPIPPIEIQREISSHITDLKIRIKDLKNEAEKNQTKAIKEFEQKIFTTA